MWKKIVRKFNAISFETSISYPFPSIMAIFLVFMVAGAYSLLTMPSYDLEVYLPREWNRTTAAEELTTTIRTMTTKAVVFSMLNSLYITLLFIPVIVGFNLAAGIRNGQIRTLLSYPIGRRKLILVKTILIFLLVSIPTSIGSLFSLVFFYPFSIDLISLCLLNITLWITVLLITSSCVVVAVTSKSAQLTIITGAGGWVIGFMLFMTPSTPAIVRSLLFPVLIAMNHINPGDPMSFLERISMSDILIGSGAAITIACLLIYLSILLFNRLEV